MVAAGRAQPRQIGLREALNLPTSASGKGCTSTRARDTSSASGSAFPFRVRAALTVATATSLKAGRAAAEVEDAALAGFCRNHRFHRHHVVDEDEVARLHARP